MDWRTILEELERKRAFAGAMGGAARLEKRRSEGKLNARERIAALFDGGAFFEIGALAGNLSETGEAPAPADGLIAGFGPVDGRPVLAAVEDFTVLGGSIGDAAASKRHRLTQMAKQERAPLVFMLEGAGHRLTNAHATPSPNDLQGLAELSGLVPMVCLVLGPSAGHGALTAPLSDFVVMTPDASLFVAGPPIVKAAIGEVITKDKLGGPQVHLSSGVAHNLATDDAAAIAMARRYLSFLPASALEKPQDADGPDRGPRRLDGILDLISPDPRVPFDARLLLGMLADEGSVLEIQPAYGASILTAFARLGGRSVAIVANNPAIMAGAIDAAAAQKAARFLAIADAFHLPVIFLTDNPGVLPGSASEQAGALRHAARLFAMQHRLQAPKLHVTLRKAFGFGSSIMAMNPFDNQTLSLAFPAISLGAMPADSGADAAKMSEAEKREAISRQTGAAWEMAHKLAYDDIIDPRDLRNALLSGLSLIRGRALDGGPALRAGILP
jgi:acetyl-CoA carboxylase carboxyltransferase component